MNFSGEKKKNIFLPSIYANKFRNNGISRKFTRKFTHFIRDTSLEASTKLKSPIRRLENKANAIGSVYNKLALRSIKAQDDIKKRRRSAALRKCRMVTKLLGLQKIRKRRGARTIQDFFRSYIRILKY